MIHFQKTVSILLWLTSKHLLLLQNYISPHLLFSLSSLLPFICLYLSSLQLHLSFNLLLLLFHSFLFLTLFNSSLFNFNLFQSLNFFKLHQNLKVNVFSFFLFFVCPFALFLEQTVQYLYYILLLLLFSLSHQDGQSRFHGQYEARQRFEAKKSKYFFLS